VLGIIGFSHWFDGIWLAAGAGCLLISGPVWPLLRRRPRTARIGRIALALALTAFLLLEALILSAALAGPEPGASYAIVLGAGVDGTTPSLTLSRRIRSAARYLQSSPDTIAVATGGQGPGEDISEAEAIAVELVRLGIDPARILLEMASTTTKENVLFARQIIEASGGSIESSVVIVSSSFHLYRAVKLAGSVGFRDVSGQGSPSMRYLEPHYFAREAAALIKEKLDGNL
jgi:uncharacterized SAM-binding protein YcdF (DUF218 family)